MFERSLPAGSVSARLQRGEMVCGSVQPVEVINGLVKEGVSVPVQMGLLIPHSASSFRGGRGRGGADVSTMASSPHLYLCGEGEQA